MDAKTLIALKGSIKKWERIVTGKGQDKGDDNCPLCKAFKVVGPLDAGGCGDICGGCPVALHSGAVNCRNTPYQNWMRAENDIGCMNNNKATTPELKAAAQAELDFLRSLLPASTPTSPEQTP